MTPPTTPDVDRFRDALDGTLLTPDSPAYDEARAVWNGMIDRRPALIARCAGEEDVIRSLRFARDHGLQVAIKGGGHNIAGSAMCDDGLVIDLSGLDAVDVDPASRSVRVQPGATLGDIDAATQPHGLALPTGINSTTGIAGLTLGGGFGWLTRAHGLTVDNLVSVDMVTANGNRVTASASQNPELFWAVRGGGANFGVVTSFTFHVHNVGPEIFAGLLVHPLADAPAVMRAVRDQAADAPDELTTFMVLRKAPPLPFVPEEWHGREVLILATMFAGPAEDGEAATARLRGLGTPIAAALGVQPFVAWQQAFDPLLTPGARNYWKSHDFSELSDDAIDTIIDFVHRLPSDQCEVFLAQLGGAANRLPVDATAYPHRDAEFLINVHTRWTDPAEDARCLAWARGIFDATAPYANGGVYVNFMPDDETDRVRAAYGANYDRLARVKAEWDPDNVFRANMNIRPAVPA